VNTCLLCPDEPGAVGWFAHETLSRIAKAHSEHLLLFRFDRRFIVVVDRKNEQGRKPAARSSFEKANGMQL